MYLTCQKRVADDWFMCGGGGTNEDSIHSVKQKQAKFFTECCEPIIRKYMQCNLNIKICSLINSCAEKESN